MHHYEPLTYDASGVHGQHHRHKRSLPEEDHKVSFNKLYRYVMAKVYWKLEFTHLRTITSRLEYKYYIRVRLS